MNYRQIQPPEYLRNHVRYFWVLESQDTNATYTFQTIADGGPGLLFQPREKGLYYQNNKLMPGLTLYGQSTVPAEIRLTGQFSTIGIHFYPNALKSVFGLDAESLTDICLDLDVLSEKAGYPLSEKLHTGQDIEHRIEVLSAYLFFLIRKNSAHADSVIDYAISQIVRSNGNISLKELHDKLCLSERSVERKFKQQVGITPKLFARICRFQASLNQMRKNSYDKLTDIAYENEYADQSHLIRSFKEFAGTSPNQFQKRSENLLDTTDFAVNDPLVGFVLFYGLQRA